MGPHELVTSAMIARQYYIDRMTKQRIGDLHGISRHKVARILRKARESGVVRIEVGRTTKADIELGETLHQKLGLRPSLRHRLPTRQSAGPVRPLTGTHSISARCQ